MNIRKINYSNVLLAAAVTLTTVSGVAFAGAKVIAPVQVTATSMYGSFGSTRNSANAGEFIYCSHEARNDGLLHGACAAMSASGIFKTCWTRNSSLMDAIKTMTDSNWVSVTFDATGQCTDIYTLNSSYHEPKVR